MPIAAAAADLHALHPVAPVAERAEVLRIERLEEARPTGARLELRRRAEQWQPAEAARVDPRLLVVEQAAAERRLRAVVEQHPPFLHGKGTGQPLAIRRGERAEVEAGR